MVLSSVTDSMVRFAAFPLAFGSCLICFMVGFYNRRKFFPEVDEIHHQRAIETQIQAVEFQQKVAEGVQRIREKKRKEALEKEDNKGALSN